MGPLLLEHSLHTLQVKCCVKYFVILLHFDLVLGERGQGQQLAPNSQSIPHYQSQPIFFIISQKSSASAAEQNRKRDVAMLSVYSNRSCPHLPCIFGRRLHHSSSSSAQMQPPHLPSSPQQCGSGRLPHRCPTGPTTDCSSFRSISPSLVVILRQGVVFVPSLALPTFCSSLWAA